MTTGVSQQPRIFTQLVGVNNTSTLCSPQKVVYLSYVYMSNGWDCLVSKWLLVGMSFSFQWSWYLNNSSAVAAPENLFTMVDLINIDITLLVCLYIYLCLFVFGFVCLVSLSVYLSAYMAVCLSVCLSMCLCVYVSVCVSMCLCFSVCLSVHPSIRLSVCLSVRPSVCLSVCLSVYQLLHSTVFVSRNSLQRAHQ